LTLRDPTSAMFRVPRVTRSGSRAFASAPPMRNKLFINNEWRSAEKTFAVVNPANEETFMECAQANAADMDTAVKAARETFFSKNWGKATTGKYRAEIVRKMGQGLRDNLEDFAVLETMDNGKPIVEARADIEACADIFEYFAKLGEELDDTGAHGGTVPLKLGDPAFTGNMRKEPVGVIGAVTPWNFPLLQAAVKVAPGLAAGCSMVLKPSTLCPATCLRLGDLALEAGLPPGALNIVPGTGREAGQSLLDHKLVHRLSFTGSGPVGQKVLEAAAKRLIPASMELGGKGAIVVFDDVDIEKAVDWVMVGIYICSGQICSATSRLILQDTIYDKFMGRLHEEVAKLKLGDPLDNATQVGPIVSKDQQQDILGYIARARAEGIKVTGGDTGDFSKGYWVTPCIMENLQDTSESWTEEIFGPVLAVRSFKTEAEAVHLANDSIYGLANAVCTVDEDRCLRVAEQLHAGVVWQNCSNVVPTEAPFGGFKESGFGKEFGEMGFEEYLQVKTIVRCDPSYSWNWFLNSK